MLRHLSIPYFKRLLEKKIHLKAVVFLVACAISLTTSELFLRLTKEVKIEPIQCRAFDRRYEAVLVANSSCRFKTGEWDVTYLVNRWGVRGRDFEKAPPAGVTRIIFVGDSFVEGYGLDWEQTFERKLEEGLGEGRFEVIGMGVAGYGSLQKARVVERALEFAPDLLVLEFNVTDFKEDLDARDRISENGDFAPPVLFQDKPIVNKRAFLGFIPREVRHFLNQNFYTYQFLNTWSKILLDWVSGKNVRSFTVGDVKADLFAVTREKTPEGYERLMTETFGEIRNAKSLVQSKKVPFAIMLVPHGHMISGSEWSKGRAYWQFENGNVYSARAFEDLKKVFEDIPILDLSEDLVGARGRKYFDRDGHFNEWGTTVVAQSLESWLVKLGFIKR